MKKYKAGTLEVEIPVLTGKDFVPSSSAYEDAGMFLSNLALCVQNKLPVLLVGETGTGKTSAVRYLASKTGNGFRRVNHSGGTTVEDIKGRVLIGDKGTYWVDGVLVEAMKQGWWYFADEINAASPEINFVYHMLLDDDGYIVLEENGGEVVKAHKDFRFFAAMNPSTDYAGTKELNKALLSRFIVLKADFPEPEKEAKILSDRTGVEKAIAEKMVRFAAEVRGNFEKKKWDFVLSTRDLILWAVMYRLHGDLMESAETAVMNKVEPESVGAIRDLLSLSIGKQVEERMKTWEEWEETAKPGVVYRTNAGIGDSRFTGESGKNMLRNDGAWVEIMFDSEESIARHSAKIVSVSEAISSVYEQKKGDPWNVYQVSGAETFFIKK